MSTVINKLTSLISKCHQNILLSVTFLLDTKVNDQFFFCHELFHYRPFNTWPYIFRQLRNIAVLLVVEIFFMISKTFLKSCCSKSEIYLFFIDDFIFSICCLLNLGFVTDSEEDSLFQSTVVSTFGDFGLE